MGRPVPGLPSPSPVSGRRLPRPTQRPECCDRVNRERVLRERELVGGRRAQSGEFRVRRSRAHCGRQTRYHLHEERPLESHNAQMQCLRTTR